jgi:hypothetical protein
MILNSTLSHNTISELKNFFGLNFIYKTTAYRLKYQRSITFNFWGCTVIIGSLSNRNDR